MSITGYGKRGGDLPRQACCEVYHTPTKETQATPNSFVTTRNDKKALTRRYRRAVLACVIATLLSRSSIPSLTPIAQEPVIAVVLGVQGRRPVPHGPEGTVVVR